MDAFNSKAKEYESNVRARRGNDRETRTFKIVLTGLMISLIVLATIIIRIPIPGTQGYIHLGDTMIFLSIMLLGWKRGAVAAAAGSALADIMGGVAIWAPWSVVVKAGMAIIVGIFLSWAAAKVSGKMVYAVQIIGMVLGGLFMTGGYFVAEAVMYGNWAAPIIGIPFNIAQFVVGGVLATVLATALCKTNARRYFTYNMRQASHV